jgi:hypothetical protein
VRRGNADAWTTLYDIGAIERNTAVATCARVSYRQIADLCNNCTAPPWNGELKRIAGDEWTASFVDGHNRPGSSRWRLTSQSASEPLLYDSSRDL